jgi:hypothetical protein
MYTYETVLVLNNPTLLKTLWRPLDVCSWLVFFGDGMLSPWHYSISVLFSHHFEHHNIASGGYHSVRSLTVLVKFVVVWVTLMCKSKVVKTLFKLIYVVSLDTCEWKYGLFGIRRPSVNFKKNLLLWNHWANLNQTWPESSLAGSL